MSTIFEAKRAYDAAREHVTKVTKDAIADALLAAFTVPEVQNVAFGVSTSPHNDENWGQGVFGPLVNFLPEDFDGEEFDRDKEYELFDSYRHSGNIHPAVSQLQRVLAEAGWEFAGEALGVSYYPDEGHGSTEAFVAHRTSPEGDFELNEFSIDY